MEESWKKHGRKLEENVKPVFLPESYKISSARNIIFLPENLITYEDFNPLIVFR